MTVKTILYPTKRMGKKRPIFVASTTFYDELPDAFGLDGSPYSAAGLRVAEDEYWEKYYEVSDYAYEWNNGVLEEKPVSDYATFKIYKWLFLLVEAYLLSHPIGKLVALETGFRLPLADKITIRKPDFFVVRNDNPTPYLDSDNRFQGIADLCVEAISDTSKKNLERDTKTKRSEYEMAGVHEFFMLDASNVHMTFYRRTPDGEYLAIPVDSDGIIRSEVLPGFQFRLTDLYRQPSLLVLSEDEVYRHFVLPEVGALKARAEQERTRAEQEYTRAERLAAKLRELGISEDDV